MLRNSVVLSNSQSKSVVNRLPSWPSSVTKQRQILTIPSSEQPNHAGCDRPVQQEALPTRTLSLFPEGKTMLYFQGCTCSCLDGSRRLQLGHQCRPSRTCWQSNACLPLSARELEAGMPLHPGTIVVMHVTFLVVWVLVALQTTKSLMKFSKESI